MSEFSKRVIRLKKKNLDTIQKDLELEIKDPKALAASHIDLSTTRSIAFSIREPRASSILIECLRLHVLGTVHKLEKEEFSTVRSRLLFGYGNAFHFWAQNTGDLFGSRRVGWWRCAACGQVLYFGKPPRARCKKCHASAEAAFYLEHRLKLKGKWPVSGHPDLFLTVKGGLIRVVEIKSINGEDFVKIVAPLAEHEAQCQTYMWGCSRDNRLPVKIDSSLGYILYISKKHMVKDLPFKMFHVEKNDYIIGHIKERLERYKRGVENYPKDLPVPYGECQAQGWRNWKAKKCAAREVCLGHAK